ncbi:MAG: SCO family protein [Gaiellaceae bacterium]
MPPLEFHMTRASDGAAVTADAWRGKAVALYFGYTHCPDVCPTTLSNLADILKRLGPDANRVAVLFVTVDPDRDTVPVLKQYARAFAPQVVGLRGSPDAIAMLARRYRVAYRVTKESPGHPYTVMHTSAVFLFDPSGRARLVTLATGDTAGLAEDVKRLLRG